MNWPSVCLGGKEKESPGFHQFLLNLDTGNDSNIT